SRPGKGPLDHQLESPIVLDLVFANHRLQLQRSLVNSYKNDLRTRGSFSAFTPQQILKRLFAPPDAGQKWSTRQKMRCHHQPGPERRDGRQDQQASAMEPMHRGIISLALIAPISK